MRVATIAGHRRLVVREVAVPDAAQPGTAVVQIGGPASVVRMSPPSATGRTILPSSADMNGLVRCLRSPAMSRTCRSEIKSSRGRRRRAVSVRCACQDTGSGAKSIPLGLLRLGNSPRSSGGPRSRGCGPWSVRAPDDRPLGRAPDAEIVRSRTRPTRTGHRRVSKLGPCGSRRCAPSPRVPRRRTVICTGRYATRCTPRSDWDADHVSCV